MTYFLIKERYLFIIILFIKEISPSTFLVLFNTHEKEMWKCLRCTVVNSSTFVICIVCNTPRPIETSKEEERKLTKPPTKKSQCHLCDEVHISDESTICKGCKEDFKKFKTLLNSKPKEDDLKRKKPKNKYDDNTRPTFIHCFNCGNVKTTDHRKFCDDCIPRPGIIPNHGVMEQFPIVKF